MKIRFLKTKWFYILLLIFLVVILGGLFYRQHQKEQLQKQEANYLSQFETINKLKGSKSFTIGDRNQFVVAPSGIFVTQNYITTPELTRNKGGRIPSRKKKGFAYNLVVQNINDNFKSQTYDMYQASNDYKKGAKVGNLLDAVRFQGRDLMVYILTKDEYSSWTVDEYVAMDLSNGQVEALPQELLDYYTSPEYQNKSPMEDYYEYYQEPLANTTLLSILDRYNLFSRVSISYLKSDSNQADSNASKSLNLFTEYASESLWDKVYGKSDYAIYPRPDSVTVEEWFNTALHWFAPSGEESLTVYAISKGQATDYPIRSYADYEAWKATQSGE